MLNTNKLSNESIVKAIGGELEISSTPKTKKSKKDELKEKLNEITENYAKEGNLSNPLLDFEKATYKPMTDDEIDALAREIYENAARAEADKLTTDAEAKKTAKIIQKEKLNADAEQRNKNIEDTAETNKESAHNESIKKGIGRSSIALEKLREIDGDRIDSLVVSDKKLKTDVDNINTEIALLEEGLQNSIKRLNENTKSKITEKIIKLKEERDDKILETLKYNNSLSEKAMKYYDNYLNEQNSADTSAKKEMAYKEKALLVSKYYSLMSAQEAYDDFIADTALQEELGPYAEMIKNLLESRLE